MHWSIPINNIVIASGRQQRDSAMYTHISILPQIPSNFLPFRFPHNIEQSSLCYTVGPSWLCILKYKSFTFKCKDVWTFLAHKSERLIFLGYKITADDDCSYEIKRHLLLRRKVLTNLDSILKSSDVTLPTKVRLVKAIVFTIIMYGCESWTIMKAEHWIAYAFEL